MGVACIDGSVMEPRRTFGSNEASIGGRVVRLDGGGVSIYIGVGPEFIALDGLGSLTGATNHN